MSPAQPTITDRNAAGAPTDDSKPLAMALVIIGFLLRVHEAWGTFLNPDEALHFFIANRASLAAAYKASLTMAHPPLLIFVLYGLRDFGHSELILRLPAILTGTFFCSVFYSWLRRLFGAHIALVGLAFAALLPPMIDVTAQVRQYGLLLVFIIGGVWYFERALAEHSPRLMLISALLLGAALFSHYSALLFVATLGLYALLRLVRQENSGSTMLAWIAGQLFLIALVIFLYLTHISKIKGTTMAEQAFDGWLRKSYFHHGSDNPLTFLITRSFSLFQYIFGQLVLGDILALLFVAGIILLLRARTGTINLIRTQLAVLFLCPFALNYVLALFDLYPYGGTRHCVYLSIFCIAVVSAGVVRIAGTQTLRILAITAVILAFSFVFRTNHAPYIARADQSRAHMDDAVRFISSQIPPSEPILVDYESGIEIGHYACNQQPISYDGSIPGSLVFHCAGHRIISTVPDLWAFIPSTFLSEWNSLVRGGYLHSGEKVWVLQAGWMVKLDEQLRTDFAEFHDLQTEQFGNNIRFFQVTASQPMPTADPSRALNSSALSSPKVFFAFASTVAILAASLGFLRRPLWLTSVFPAHKYAPRASIPRHRRNHESPAPRHLGGNHSRHPVRTSCSGPSLEREAHGGVSPHLPPDRQWPR